MRLVLAFLLTAALPASADEPAWPDLREALFGDPPIRDASGMIALSAPLRSDDDARTFIGADIDAPPGRAVREVTVVLDNNPMPVSAVIELAHPLPHFRFDATLRINGPTPLHVVVELDDGALMGAETFVKTSGQGACAAPPGTDPAAALATLGDMTISFARWPGGATDALRQLENAQTGLTLDISHPSHSGMQMDQITLLFTPMRYVDALKIALDGRPYADVTGSISLSENPQLRIAVPAATRRADVTLTDTDGTERHATQLRAGY